jgi:two-component system, response regulator PdtaR
MFEVCKQEKNNPVVLVVEDEYLVVLVAIELVSELGFKTISAKNADEAIAV